MAAYKKFTNASLVSSAPSSFLPASFSHPCQRTKVFMMSLSIPVPDMIKDMIKHQEFVEVKEEQFKERLKHIQRGILKSAEDPSGDIPSVHTTFVDSELQRAYASGDYDTIDDRNNKAAIDMQAPFVSIQRSGEKAFLKIANKSDGNEYYIIPSENGWMWAYSYAEPSSTESPTPACYVSIGTYSARGNILGISQFVWDNKWCQWTPRIASFVFSFLVGRFVQQRILGALFTKSVEKAMDAAAADTDEAFSGMSYIFWGTGGGALAGAVSGAVATALLTYLINFVVKEYFLVTNVWNWTSDTWTISDWHSDNADVSQPGKWATTEVPRAYKLPDGTVVPASIVYYSTFAFNNHNKVLEGLGIGFKVVLKKDPSQGFVTKYCVHRLKLNQLGILGDGQVELRKYYEDSSQWAPAYKTTMHGSIPQSRVPLLASTPSINGDPHQLYTIDIHIGQVVA
ncbi:hypothetical protein BDW22DRAFT_1426507 [Trametopsis cervina]|nr:hypothetical protein BDW22DRAFT_1426507 [Trametopsis cervina]